MPNPLSEEQQAELLREVKMLRDYSQALEDENRTRNQERVILEKQIQRLSRYEKERQPAQVQQCQECGRLKSEIIKLENQVERLKRQNSNLQSSYNVLSESLSKMSTEASRTTTTMTVKRVATQLQASNVTLGAGGNIGRETLTHVQITNKELLARNNELNSENVVLKKQLSELEQKATKLEQENQGKSIKISSLELQIHNLKSSLSARDNEIFSYKSKSMSVSSSNELELKALKESAIDKDKEMNVLRQRLTQLSAVQFELRGLKSNLAARENQIAELKGQANRNEQDGAKIYKLEGEIRSMKYQITNKDSEIQTLKNKVAELSSFEFSKVSAFELELKNLKLSVAAKESDLSSAQSQLKQLASLRSQISSLQAESRQWRTTYQQQVRQNKANSSVQPTAGSQLGEQIAGLTAQLHKLRQESGEKDVYIRRVEDELKEMTRRDEEKNMEVRKLDSIVTSYMEKIGELQVQLNRLQKNSLNGQVNASNSGMSNSSLPGPNQAILLEQNRVLNEKIRDQERRIGILEDTNRSLREELRISIELRSRESSRIVTSPPGPYVDEELLGTIKLLKQELQETRGILSRVKSDNEYLQAKLSSSELQVQHLVGLSKMGGIRVTPDRLMGKAQPSIDVVKSAKLLGNLPIAQSKMSSTAGNFGPAQIVRRKQVKVQHNYTVLDDNQRNPITSVVSGIREPRVSKVYQKQTKQVNSFSKEYDRVIEVTNIGGGSNTSQANLSKASGNAGRPMDELQRKIEMLKQENKGLRKHLYQAS